LSGWASLPLEGNPDLVMSSLERGMTVGLIPTFNPLCCEARDEISEVVDRDDLREFDYVPVEENGTVVGLLERTKPDLPDGRPVRAGMTPLHGDLLRSSDAGILSYIEGAERFPCRLVLSQDTVNSIITLSDLQKLLARPAIFLLVTHVELLMAQWIRRNCTSEGTWLDELSDGRRDQVNDKWADLQSNSLAIDKLAATEFADKVDVLLKLRPPDGKTKARKELKRVERLRDGVAHAGDYVLTRESAEKTVATVLAARRWIADLQEVLRRD
jgi:hypothetical protein